jgi:hypothetical protein
MAIEMQSLFETAFFVDDVQNASESIERALETYESATHAGARVFETVAPEAVDEAWVGDQLARLVYFCESEGSTVPTWSGVIVALFHGGRLYGIAADHVVRWGCEVLGVSSEELHRRYGIGEADTARPS